MNNYPPHPDDPRYPNQKRPANQQPSWGNSGWGNDQGQPQSDDPYASPGSYGQHEQHGQHGQYGQYAPPSQQPQTGYGQYGGQDQYGQYGSSNQYDQSRQGWGYGTPASQSQYGSYGQSNQYGAPYQQSPYVPNAAPPPYGYSAPGQQDLDYGYDDAPPRKSRRGLYIVLSISGVIIAIMVICAVLANIPPPAPAVTASIAGTWHGRTNVAANNIGTLAAETYMHLQQSGTTVTGTGKVCVNKQGKALEFMNMTINGSMSGTNATMTWHYVIMTTGAKGDGELTGSLANGTLSLTEQDQSGNFTLGVKKGTEQEYLAACRQLPGS